MSHLVIRPLDQGEEELFLSRPDPDLLGLLPTHFGYRTLSSEGQYRPEWSWVALRHGLVVARAGWWGGPYDTTPRSLDFFDFDDVADGAALLRAAPFRVGHDMRLPLGWQADPVTGPVVEARVAAAAQAGMRVRARRLRYLWESDQRAPAPSDRLVFSEEPDDEAVLDAFRRIQADPAAAPNGSGAAVQGLGPVTERELEPLLGCPPSRSWWRLARTRDGDLVGLAVPARNHVRPVVAFVGVVPAHRGHGYGYDLLAEATRILAGHGADEIAAGADAADVPTSRALVRAGYRLVGEQLDLL
ncbi:GNAT family N-acetyltransferase [Nonomuraea pusilla]|uniref:Acetyltransferase (GNAT) family protein n=1 Tax=Nonomuraea pusilla TaxID=46177 RepID=A0A1H7I4X3_9ACTN|nr:GNAT family N-acetyltransferase [Nonomuraea pusilla]SEK57633.1 Acetyltransferase (GNAT) family protein [Nonomuraea pusilla]